MCCALLVHRLYVIFVLEMWRVFVLFCFVVSLDNGVHWVYFALAHRCSGELEHRSNVLLETSPAAKYGTWCTAG